MENTICKMVCAFTAMKNIYLECILFSITKFYLAHVCFVKFSGEANGHDHLPQQQNGHL